MNFHLGCAIWAYKGWLGEFFPADSRATDFLHLYSRRFTAVEGNTTFYSIPDAETVKRWATETPDGFKFCLKLPKSLTHHGSLQPTIPGTIDFLGKMSGLGDRLGPFFAQLPPSYSPSNFADLAAFLTALPRHEAEFAVEVRHPAWFKAPYVDQLTQLLERLGVGRVLLDTRPIYDSSDDPQLQSDRRKPKLPLQPNVTAPFSLIRFISHPDLALNQPFLESWVALVEQWLQQGTRIYFFVHCPVEERSPANARHFQHLLEQHKGLVPPLPWDAIVETTPTQLNLFNRF